MGDVALVESDTGIWVAGPFPDTTEIEVPEGRELIPVVPGWPDEKGYDAATKSFPDLVTTPTAAFWVEMTPAERGATIDHLVSVGVLTATRAATLKLV